MEVWWQRQKYMLKSDGCYDANFVVLRAPEIVLTTTSGATSNDNVDTMKALGVHCQILADSDLVTPYGVINLGQHWRREWSAAWRHQAITWTYVDVLSKVSCVIHIRAISQEVLMNFFS